MKGLHHQSSQSEGESLEEIAVENVATVAVAWVEQQRKSYMQKEITTQMYEENTHTHTH